MDKSLVVEKYYEFIDEKHKYSFESKELYLKFLISLNSCVYDVYVLLKELYSENNEYKKGSEIVELGYTRLMENEFNNKLPKLLDYYELKNRAVYRLIYAYGDMFWIAGDNEKAIRIFKELLRMNPNDNLGVRYSICGILEGYRCSNEMWNDKCEVIPEWYKSNIEKYTRTKEYSFLKKFLF